MIACNNKEHQVRIKPADMSNEERLTNTNVSKKLEQKNSIPTGKRGKEWKEA